jgi:diketogulonate reductase-like aldo/keto reductase
MKTGDLLRYARLPLTHGPGSIPAVGFGTLISGDAASKAATKRAIEAGFRHIDTAERYRNEEAVGEAIWETLQTGVARRDEVFVSAKLWNTNHRPERVKPAFLASLKRLRLDYVDCYLIHTPFAFQPGKEPHPKDVQGKTLYDSGVTLMETWGALERLLEAGYCGSIGLSDVSLGRVQSVLSTARIKPAVVQVECHPYYPQWDLVEFCHDRGIVVQAFAALGHAISPRLLDDPVVRKIANRLRKTPAQVLLAWAVQRETAFLTTSTNPQHIRENFEISTLPKDALQEIERGITTSVRFNGIVETGVPEFVPRLQ